MTSASTTPHEHLPVALDRVGAVATIRLNRPEAMNALDTATKEALLAAVRQVAEDSSIRCLVLTGSGKAFCVGQDLKEHIGLLHSGRTDLGDTVRYHYNPIALALATMPKPVIAALNGVAAGAGASFAFGADVRIATTAAGINLAFAQIGLSADSGATWWLPRLVGPAKAKELLFHPRTIPADECLRLGLVTQVVAEEDFERTVADAAAALAAGPTAAYAAIRQAVAFSVGHELAEALANEADHMDWTGASADHRVAVQAFLDRVPPQFTGR
ncbi:MAG: enoyl-CoA hydratase/isomerase family protein [Nostocoides sp.]